MVVIDVSRLRFYSLTAVFCFAQGAYIDVEEHGFAHEVLKEVSVVKVEMSER
jgi:hypothetical protein